MMVCTTLTTLASGQSSMISSTISHQQHSQQQLQEELNIQSTLTVDTAPSTANISNYQRSLSSIPTTATTLTTTTPVTADIQRSHNNNHYYNSLALNGNNNNYNKNNNNNNLYVKSNYSAISDSEFNRNKSLDQKQLIFQLQEEQKFVEEEGAEEEDRKNFQNHNKLNGKRNKINTTISALVTSGVTEAIDETTKYDYPNQYETTKSNIIAASTATSALNLNLSDALVTSSPPPLNDQISLLFPKCRPKQTQQNNNSNTTTIQTSGHNNFRINGIDSEQSTTTDINLLVLNDDIESSERLQITASTNNNNNCKKKIVRTTQNNIPSTTNYYKNVNIITQSPPPPSISSVSSESLSSVTPRISTNPFLCSNIEDDYPPPPLPTTPTYISSQGNLLSKRDLEEKEVTYDKEDTFPVPNYSSSYSYYNKSKVDHPQTTESNAMPRKRVAYNPGYHHHTQSQKSLLKRCDGVLTNEDKHCSPSNPFLKDNSSYWERESSVLNSTVKNNNGLATSSLNDSSTEMDAPFTSIEKDVPATRHTYQQQQVWSNTNNGYGGAGKQTQAHQHHKRITPSPIQRYNNHGYQKQLPQPRKYDTLPASKRIYQQQYAYKTSMQQGRYNMYGNKSSSLESHGNSALTMDYWEKREKALNRDEYERERERDIDREREKERLREHDWIKERESKRVRDWEHEASIRNWEKEREIERRYEESGRKRLHNETNLVVHDIYDIGQIQQQSQPIRQHKQANYSMVSNGEVVVFDDITENWQNLRVTTEPNTSLQDNQKNYDDKLIFKELKRSAERNYNMSLETHHGIIEYEGSPRRIGGVAPEESSRINRSNITDIQDKIPKTSPEFPARPGFPQRIISSPRDCTPPTFLAVEKSDVSQQQYASQKQQQAQQQKSHSLPQHSSAEYNAEDTSNDVSEIGTISDMHTPEVISPIVLTVATTATTNDTMAAIYTPSKSYASSTLEGSNTLADNTPKEVPTTSVLTNITTTPTTCTIPIAAAATTKTTTINSDVLSVPTKSSTFDYLYEFSETRKVLEEFFKCSSQEEEKPLENTSDVDSIDIQYEFHTTNLELDVDIENNEIEPEGDDEDDNEDNIHIHEIVISPEDKQENINTTYKCSNQKHIQQQTQLKKTINQTEQQKIKAHEQKHTVGKHHRRHFTGSPLMRSFDFFLDSVSRSSAEQLDVQQDNNNHYCYSPETTDYDSNCGDLDSLSGEMNDIPKTCPKYKKFYETPKQENIVSSDHTTDSDINCEENSHLSRGKSILQRTANRNGGGISMLMESKRITNNANINNNSLRINHHNSSLHTEVDIEDINRRNSMHTKSDGSIPSYIPLTKESPYNDNKIDDNAKLSVSNRMRELLGNNSSFNNNNKVFKNIDPDIDSLYSISKFINYPNIRYS